MAIINEVKVVEQMYIAYYRVSTQRQGQSGLGLDAQRASVENFLRNKHIIEEFTDIETGKNDQRPALMKAIEKVRETGSILVIAKLDRLSRNLTFISKLMDSKIRFVCVDLPEASELTLHIFAALAQWERKRISERTKEALAQLKMKGIQLGSPHTFCEEIRALGVQKIKERARNNINNIKAKKMASLLRNSGKTLDNIAFELNETGFKTATGKQFCATQVRRLLINLN